MKISFEGSELTDKVGVLSRKFLETLNFRKKFLFFFNCTTVGTTSKIFLINPDYFYFALICSLVEIIFNFRF